MLGQVKVSNILYEIANLLCVAAECISRGYVPPPPMQKKEWEKVKKRVMAQATADYAECELPKHPVPFQWFDPNCAPDPACVMVEIQSRVNIPEDGTATVEFRWKCWDCHTEGPQSDSVTAATGALGHLTGQHPDERWPEIRNP